MVRILDAPGQLRTYLPLASSPANDVDDWDLLPPLPEMLEAVNKFTRHYFQLGFIPKLLFPERLRTQHRPVSPFFLLGILSVSARLTPPLVERYGSAVKASEAFMELASELTQSELYKEPTLERCQAFYLLSIAQQGSGMKHKSSVRRVCSATLPNSVPCCLCLTGSQINMAIAMRMATLMQLHREETYVIPSPTQELIIRAESARRTLVRGLDMSLRERLEADSPSLVDAAQPGQLAFWAAIPRFIIGKRHHDTASEQRGGFCQRTRTQVQGRA